MKIHKNFYTLLNTFKFSQDRSSVLILMLYLNFLDFCYFLEKLSEKCDIRELDVEICYIESFRRSVERYRFMRII
jgi:hypothetical protein